MITTLAASLALLLPTAQSAQWGPTTLKASVLADRVDARLARVSNTTLKYHYDLQTSTLGYAFKNCESLIFGPGRFRLQMPRVVPGTFKVMFDETWIGDGKRYGVSVDEKKPAVRPLATRPTASTTPLSLWFRDFSRVILSGIGQPTHAFANLVADAKRQKFTTVVETRAVPFRGRILVANRIVLSRGFTRYEVVIDGKQSLPVNVINSNAQGTSGWADVDWNFRPGKALDPKLVELSR